MKTLVAFLFFVAQLVIHADDGLNVELRFLCPGKLATEAQQQLSSEALSLLKTSSLNTATHNSTLKIETRDIQTRYRRVAGDKYLLVSFKEPREVQTEGGLIKVQEIFIGLTGPLYGPLFTIDPESRVVEHIKYDDDHLDKLLKLVQQLTSMK